jgi:hypothetical protein
MKSYTDMELFLQDVDKRLRKLEEHYIYQIDENRKISNRIDKLESKIKSIDAYLKDPF